MRILLDTHALLWFHLGDSRLSSRARNEIENSGNENLVSISSIWEIAIKVSLGKLELQGEFDEVIPNAISNCAATILSLEFLHLSKLVQLPFHHRDPFDRVIISQALAEDIAIVGVDEQFDSYDGVARRW